MSRKIFAFVLTTSLTLPAIASAQASDGWRDVDRDGDGSVSLAEMQAQRADRFGELDSDRSGLLDRSEMSAARERVATLAPNARGGQRSDELQARMFARADGNGDGALSRDEFIASAEPVFSRLDRNGDGLITSAEREALSQRLGRFRR